MSPSVPSATGTVDRQLAICRPLLSLRLLLLAVCKAACASSNHCADTRDSGKRFVTNTRALQEAGVRTQYDIARQPAHRDMLYPWRDVLLQASQMLITRRLAECMVSLCDMMALGEGLYSSDIF